MYDELIAGINSDNLLINYQILQFTKLVFENNRKLNTEIIELLKEIRDDNKRRNTGKSI